MSYTINEHCDPHEQIYTNYYESKYNLTLGYLVLLFMLNLFQYFLYVLYYFRYQNLSTSVTNLLHNIRAKYNIFQEKDVNLLDIEKLQKTLDDDIGVYEEDWCLSNRPIASS